MCEDICIYIFGYGSLIWRPGFPYLRKIDGYIKGWKRVFWQGSTDHRGTPEAPGRVVTLVRDPSLKEETWGTVYCIPDESASSVLKNLDYREKGGYIREEVDIFIRGRDTPVVKAIVYLATEENTCFLGESAEEHIAQQIYKSIGPSGPNVDYLLNLAESMRKMNVDDMHIINLEKMVIELVKTQPLQHHTHPSLLCFVSHNSNSTTTTTTTTTIISTDLNSSSSSLQPSSDSISEAHNNLQRKYFLSPTAKVKGEISIDDGACMAVSQRGRSLLAAGIKGVKGDFGPQDLVSIIDSVGTEISRGITAYSREEIDKIQGLHSTKIAEILGFTRGESVVHHDNLILI
eukprot:TRINITY_DN1602_c3_g1_i2.p1 TRINITY_DN1602_c3_g1~~TRINITY_DN1602_c3_g1_i2.p1  ORF type:complete len:346 (-),score=107.38 TRINITY_DN1602_c3_g1_i2:74-1111(-)